VDKKKQNKAFLRLSLISDKRSRKLHTSFSCVSIFSFLLELISMLKIMTSLTTELKLKKCSFLLLSFLDEFNLKNVDIILSTNVVHS